MVTFTTPSGRFLVASHGNGWAYAVTDQDTGHSFWVQDYDAEVLQGETADFTNEDMLHTYMECIGEEA
jgi:hypothetical protein